MAERENEPWLPSSLFNSSNLASPKQPLPNQETIESPVTVIRPSLLGGRKSLGRRVSFAAHAHVRLFEGKEESTVQEESVETPAPTIESPGKIPTHLTGWSPAPLQRSSLSNHSHSSTPTNINRLSQQVNLSSQQLNSEFEVALRHEDDGFESYEEVSEEGIVEDHNNMEMTMAVGGIIPAQNASEQQMEMTQCVGGIISEHNVQSAQMEMTQCVGGIIPERMDLTECVGGIIEAAKDDSDHEMEVEMPTGRSSIDTMELTQCVGGILKANETEADAMDMTMPIPNTLLASPSPFLIPSGGSPHFIMDQPRPPAMDHVMASSPVVVMSAEDRLFNDYIDQSKFVDDEVQEPAKQQPIVIPQKRTLPLSNSVTASPTLKQRLDTPVTLKSQHFLASPLLKRTPLKTPLRQSPIVASKLTSKVGTPLKALSLRDWLQAVDVRFLDNLSSLTRRETTGRPRESEVFTPAKQTWLAAALAPECDALEQACGDLLGLIGNLREDLGEQEHIFEHAPPLAYLQWQQAEGDEDQRSLIKSRLKTLKSVARLYAKQSWYNWRTMLQSNLNEALVENRQTLATECVNMQSTLSLCTEQRALLAARRAEVSRRVQALRLKRDQMGRHSHQEMVEMTQAVHDQSLQLKALQEQATRAREQEASLRQAIEHAQEAKQRTRLELDRVISEQSQLAQAHSQATDEQLTEYRANVALLQAVTGVELVRAKPGVVLKYHSNHLLHIDERSVSVQTTATNCLLQHANLFLTSPSVLQSLLSLDKLRLLDQQLRDAASRCTVSLVPGEEGVGIRLTFFHFESRVKFDILLFLSPSPHQLEWAGLTLHYGTLDEPAIVDAARQVLANKSLLTLTRLITTVSELIMN